MKRIALRNAVANIIAKSGASRRRGPLALVQAMIDGAEKEDRVISNISDWQRLKVVIIAERGPACEACPTVMPHAGMVHLHHVIPRAEGGTDHRENAALLCPNCHSRAHWLYRTLARIPESRDAFFEMLRSAA